MFSKGCFEMILPFFVRLSLVIFLLASGWSYAEDYSGNISWTEQDGEKIVHVYFSGNEVIFFTQTRASDSGSYETSGRRERVLSAEIMNAFISDLLTLQVLEWDERYPASEGFICVTEIWTLALRLQQGTVSSLGYCMEPPNFAKVVSLFENLAAQVADN